jgi:5-methylcytosine-specific restriction endonuclease McrA
MAESRTGPRRRDLRFPKVGKCLRCAKPFAGQRSKIYCSNQCASNAWAKRQRAANPKERGQTPGKCLVCSAPFRGYATKRFCGRRCAQKSLRLTEPAVRARGRAFSREYRRRFPDRVRAQRERDRERIREYLRGWRQRNREKLRDYSARYRLEHHDRELAKSRKYHRLNAEYRRQGSAEWRRKNPDRHAFLSAARRARELNAVGSHTYAEWRAMVALFEGRCAYCGRLGPLTRDHVIPLARGGSNSIGNILPCCRTCNGRKSVAELGEFRARLAREWLAG